MTQIKFNTNIISLLFICSLVTVTCYPTGKPKRAHHPNLGVEKRYPNGTIVGKYSYVDNDGNPIQVKYFADQSSYGVELKSLKMTASPTESASAFHNPLNSILPHAVAASKKANILNTMETTPEETDTEEEQPRQHSNEKPNKAHRYKPEKASSDFEIYYQNELKEPEQCGKEKVHVYYDKERNVRNAVDELDAEGYCGQF